MTKTENIIRIVKSITELETKNGGITPEQAGYIGSLFDGDAALFRELDEKPGLYASPEYHGVRNDYTYFPWHWKLRQARNNHDEFWNALEA